MTNPSGSSASPKTFVKADLRVSFFSFLASIFLKCRNIANSSSTSSSAENSKLPLVNADNRCELSQTFFDKNVVTAEYVRELLPCDTFAEKLCPYLFVRLRNIVTEIIGIPPHKEHICQFSVLVIQRHSRTITVYYVIVHTVSTEHFGYPSCVTLRCLTALSVFLRCYSHPFAAVYKPENISTVIDNIGQELHLAIKKSSNFNDYKYNEWLRTLGRYISSLSDITRIKFNDIYISFEDPSVQTPTSRCDYIKNESGEIVGILIKYQPGTSEDQFNMIMNDYCDWGIFHEISHAYGYLNDITQSYSNFNSYGDEGLVNVRAMAAVQNCKDLKNKQFMLNGFRLGNYTHALSDAANAGNYYLNGLFDQLYIYDKYANSFVDGWAVIEKIMLGDKCELDNETLNTAIEFVKSSGGYTYGGNPNCITNHESYLPKSFRSSGDETLLECEYCDERKLI